MNILLGCTGSVATTVIHKLVYSLWSKGHDVRIVTTIYGEYFLNKDKLVDVEKFDDGSDLYDNNGTQIWSKKGDPVLHIDLAKWADVFVIAPLTANTLAKIANGLCDNLLTSIVKAWGSTKPLIVAPSMNINMWDNVITQQHLDILEDILGIVIVEPVDKQLACGDTGIGAMAHTDDIIRAIRDKVGNDHIFNLPDKELPTPELSLEHRIQALENWKNQIDPRCRLL